LMLLLSAVAEAERDRIRERIRDVKADQRKRRRYLGGIAGSDCPAAPHAAAASFITVARIV